MRPEHRESTLFPYTTLFRSINGSRSTVTVFTTVSVEPSITATAFPSAQQPPVSVTRSEEHTSELQSLRHLVCRLLLEKKKTNEKIETTCPANRADTRHILRQ